MQILAEILETLADGVVLDVRIGLHWTAVVVESEGVRRCGLATTLSAGHDHRSEPDVPQAGELEQISGRELAGYVLDERPMLVSAGLAALNALLPLRQQDWSEENAEELLGRLGRERRVALIGHFPFIPRLRQAVRHLDVLELEPGPGDLPADMAPQVLPQADVVAITGMTLANHTLEGLLELCSPGSTRLVLGPSTPLSPVLFEHGVNFLSGAIVTAIEPVLRTVSQGGNFRQVHRAGVRLVNMHVSMGGIRNKSAV